MALAIRPSGHEAAGKHAWVFCPSCPTGLRNAGNEDTIVGQPPASPRVGEAHPSIKSDSLTNIKPADIFTAPYGYSPYQIRGAYGLEAYVAGMLTNPISFNGIPGDGRGQTIAIVDAYDDPTALDDLNYFSAFFGLPLFNMPGGPTFQQLNQTGGTSLPEPDPAGPWIDSGNITWEVEESLDIAVGARHGPHGQHHPL